MELTIFIIILPLVTAFLLGILYFFDNKISNSVVIISSLLNSSLIILVIQRASRQPLIYSPGEWGDLGINLIVDSYSSLMLSIIALLLPLTILYSLKYVQENSIKFFSLVFLMTAGVTGMVITADLFNLFVFFEITSITSYALVAIPKRDSSIEGAFKYAVLGTISGFFILLAIIFCYQATGQLGIPQVAAEFGNIPAFLQGTIITFFIFGFGLKFALVPLHAWLPDSYSGAPLPYNVLSSALVIKASLMVLFRILYLLPKTALFSENITAILIYWGVFTFLVAHITAYQQKSIIRLLAYSSIAQIGYITIGMSLATEAGIIGGSFHLLNHAIMKACLFFTAGIIITYCDSRKVKDFKGFGYQQPLIAVTFIFGGLAIIGLPPFNGFVSKWFLIIAALEADYTIAAFFIPVGSFLSLTYYLRIFKQFYSGPDNKLTGKKHEKNNSSLLNLKLPAYLLAILCLLIGVFPALPLQLINSIPQFLLERINYITMIPGG